MRCPNLSELPPAPTGRRGWPWTEETPPAGEVVGGGSLWPRVTVVTPSYNQGEYLEETLRSVLLQGYPDLEYIVVDGGSRDGSVDVIRRYEPWLTYWVSERDSGQSEAINKGLARCTGTILAWLNSDDRLQPGAMQAMVRALMAQPPVGVMYGDYAEIDERGELLGRHRAPAFDIRRQVVRQLIPQPAAFFRRAVWEQVGPLNPEFHYIMDRDLWTRAALYWPIVHVPVSMADMRIHSVSKTVAQTERFMLEAETFLARFFAREDLAPDIRALQDEAEGANQFGLGRILLKNGRRDEARQAFTRSWLRYPRFPRKLLILPFLFDAACGTNLGDSLMRALRSRADS